MSKVAVVTDSTAYIPKSLSQGLPIHVVPLQVVWGGETYRDGVDIQPLEFYTRLKTAKVMPTTSQPSPEAFRQVYATLLEEGYDIVSIHISAKLSGTLDSAIQARAMLKSERIEVVDSKVTAMALGYHVLSVARAAAQGATFEECKALAHQAVNHTGAVFVVSTLEFLHRGGRIGGAAAFLGTALNLKPLLELRDGRVEAVERIRTLRKAVDRLLDLLDERVGERSPLRLACLHANAPQEAEELMERVRQRYPQERLAELVLAEVSPVIGTHTGPGTVGIAYMAGM
jgi:DegV family protein with EDD domain